MELKWPNDVLHDGAKLGGILLEMSGDAAGSCRVVIGVGLNVAMPEAAAHNIDQAWTDIKAITSNPSPSRSKILAALLNALLPLLADFEQHGFAHWREEWQSLDALADAAVVLHAGDVPLAGIARGVDTRGALQLETVDGLQSVYGGEISLRAAAMSILGNCLQLDIGNTSAKWRLVNGNKIVSRGDYWPDDADSQQRLLNCCESLDHIWISSVTAAASELSLVRLLENQWGIAPWFARSESRTGSLINSYEEPSRMGVDRWLAMLAGRARNKSRFCVIDGGSALTIDIVSANGRHEGGYIIPGAALMERALLLDTDQVRFDEEVGYGLSPGTSTAHAVRHGIALAQAGAIALALEQAADEPMAILFCGGAGQSLMELVDRGGEVVQDLVFEGLAIMAALR